MGGGRFDTHDWAKTRSNYSYSAKPTVDHIYTSRDMNPALDPKSITIRESRDSDANPQSTALIVGLDVTGSMGMVLDVMARQSLGTLVEEIYNRKPISDPHVMVMGIGDCECDRAPLQVTQFEAENQPLVTQMESIFLERGGGGNHHESYAAAWLFAAMKTSIDCFEKRGKRGYLFTVGDEGPTPKLFGQHIRGFLGLNETGDMDGRAILEKAQMTYDVFHVMVEEGSHFRQYGDRVRREWTEILGERAISLRDHEKLAEVVVSAIQVAEGAAHDDVVKSWSGDTSLVVADAIKNVNAVAKVGGTAGAGHKLY
jgi:hypothetical protein